ncbi:hypothetical protein [Thiocystis violascens]|uniref:DUF4365 domain-containing protein n=1 Tax=Thiocystis violascens (strain ATCC 17096 / DSM 198 / 6111) TaxID=765911 RepID=I3Y8E4_THIV6|nr:hypothetical protein [Thiocystis violascens]AFL73262.1 hypothetical protein Thivi_1239 [Thiocystis violascens DSM 198]
MDTSQLEHIAEDHICSRLQQHGILVAKPKFDILGTDLLAFTDMKDGIKFCRIQSKGRSLLSSASSNVTIAKNHVSSGFIVFLYLVFCESDQRLYVFFESDIQQWSTNSKQKEYKLSISATTAKENLKHYEYDASKGKLIKAVIANAEASGEFHRLIYGCVSATLPPMVGAAFGTVINQND